jgi:hypothetical protein
MRTLIDNESGAVVFIPDNDADRRILFHLLNCVDLKEFSTYLSLEQKVNKREVTCDLGVSADMLKDYPLSTKYDPYPFVIDRTGPLSRKIEDEIEFMNIPPDEELVPYGSLLIDDNRRLIGFCRDSAHIGYKFKEVPK